MSVREKNTNLFVFDERRTEKETNIMAKVGIVMGSDSDMPVMAKAADILEKLGIDYEMTIISAHREPDVFFEYAKSAESKGFKVIIATSDEALLERLKAYSKDLKEQVQAKDARLQEVGYKNY